MMWFKDDDFTGRVVLITGASRGIGFVTARTFLEKGARVAFCGKDSKRLAAAEQQLLQFGEVEAARADVRDMGQLETLVSRTCDRFGRIDVLVNNAGRVAVGDFAEQDKNSIDEIIDVNLKGVLYTTRVVLPVMLAQKEGVIINVSSGAGLSGFAGLVTYCASKFGVVGFTESLAREVRILGVRVYGVCPGRVATDLQEEYSGRRQGIPAEKVAEKILRLAGAKPLIDPGKCLPVS